MNSRIKLSARAAISGSYLSVAPAVAATALSAVFFSLCNAVLNYFFESESTLLAVLTVLTLLASVISTAGIKLYSEMRFLALARGKNRFMRHETGFAEVFRACELLIKLFFLKLFWLAVFEMLPASLMAFFIGYISRNAVSLRAVYAVAMGLLTLSITGVFFYCVFIQRYSRAWFYLACYRDFTAGDAVKESIRKTREKLCETFFFKLSFAPWFLLCVAIFPAFYVIPYYKQSVTCFYLSR